MRICAIHQPNFFPWLGYFDKIRRADVFVILDHVQFQKTGGTWSNRVKVLVSGEPRWITAPVERAHHGIRLINQIRFNESSSWREKLFKTLSANYRKAPFFSEAIELLGPQVCRTESGMASYNIQAVTAIANALGIDTTKLIRSSSLAVVGQGTDLLIAITRAVGGGSYMCGGGAAAYQDDQAFARSGLGPVYQDFSHPVYPQSGSRLFVPGLSVIDALMNCGIRGTRALLC